jgi:hypothetical protein
LAVPFAAYAGPDTWTSTWESNAAVAVAVLLFVALVVGPWVVSLWIFLRRSSAIARLAGALYAIGSALAALAIIRDPLWASIVGLPALLLAIGRRPFDRLTREIGRAWRTIWRAL